MPQLVLLRGDQVPNVTCWYADVTVSDMTYPHNVTVSDRTYPPNVIVSDRTYPHNVIVSDRTYPHRILHLDSLLSCNSHSGHVGWWRESQ